MKTFGYKITILQSIIITLFCENGIHAIQDFRSELKSLDNIELGLNVENHDV